MIALQKKAAMSAVWWVILLLLLLLMMTMMMIWQPTALPQLWIITFLYSVGDFAQRLSRHKCLCVTPYSSIWYLQQVKYIWSRHIQNMIGDKMALLIRFTYCYCTTLGHAFSLEICHYEFSPGELKNILTFMTSRHKLRTEVRNICTSLNLH